SSFNTILQPSSTCYPYTTLFRSYVPVLVTAAVLAVLAYVLSSFYVFMLNEILLLSIVALSLNLLLGYSGMISFGHAAYYGLGARSEEHTSELQSRENHVCRLLLK